MGELEDIAVLKLVLDKPLPAEIQPAPIARLNCERKSFFGYQVQMCGFPGGVDQGTHIDGMLKGRTGAGSWEIHPLDKSRPVEQVLEKLAMKEKGHGRSPSSPEWLRRDYTRLMCCCCRSYWN